MLKNGKGMTAIKVTILTNRFKNSDARAFLKSKMKIVEMIGSKKIINKKKLRIIPPTELIL